MLKPLYTTYHTEVGVVNYAIFDCWCSFSGSLISSGVGANFCLGNALFSSISSPFLCSAPFLYVPLYVPVASGKELLTMTAAGGTKFIIGSPFTKTLSQPASKYLSSSRCERLVKFSVLSRSASNELLNGDFNTHVAPTPDARWKVARIRFALASCDHRDMVAVLLVVVVLLLRNLHHKRHENIFQMSETFSIKRENERQET